MRSPNNNSGQTLFELTITLLILSSLLLFSIQGMQHLRKKEQGRSAINRIAVAVQEVRHQALSHRQVMTLCPSKTGANCDGVWNGALIIFAGWPADTDKTIASNFTESGQGWVKWQSFRQDNFLQMQGNGLTLGQNGTFVYCPEDNDAHYAHALIVNKSGRMRMAIDMDGDGIKDLRKGEPVSCSS